MSAILPVVAVTAVVNMVVLAIAMVVTPTPCDSPGDEPGFRLRGIPAARIAFGHARIIVHTQLGLH